jgi:hypothetical protein
MLELCFHHVVVIFRGTFFVISFLYLGMHIICLSFVVVCIHIKCYITNDVHFIMCALCEKKWLKKLVDQKRKNVLFSSMFFYNFFLDKKLF